MKLFLLIAALLGISLWGPLNRRHVRHYWKTALDKRVPLLPIFVIPYVCLFPFVIFAFIVLAFTPHAIAFYLAMSIASYSAALFWYFFPTGFRHPQHVGRGKLRYILKEIYMHEGIGNAFPSSHVYLSVVSGYFLAATFPYVAAYIWLMSICIAISTIFVRQHEIADIVGGVIWGALSIVGAYFLLGF